MTAMARREAMATRRSLNWAVGMEHTVRLNHLLEP